MRGGRARGLPAQMIAKEAMVTLDRVEGYRVVRSFGRVTGSAARPQNLFRATFRSIGALVGLAPVEYLTDAERAREEALDALARSAEAVGANAVIDLRFRATEGADGSTRVLADGEAVVLDREKDTA